MNTGHYHKHEINTAFPFLAETHPSEAVLQDAFIRNGELSLWEQTSARPLVSVVYSFSNMIVTPRGKRHCNYYIPYAFIQTQVEQQQG
jgi:hypothetical protein